jgi:hypothetical protein
MISRLQKNLFEQIGKYLEIAEDLVFIVENSNSKISDKQFTLIENYILRIQSDCDLIASVYLEFLDGKRSKKDINKIHEAFNDISATNQEYLVLIESMKQKNS